MKVYILSVHEGYGAEDVRATLDSVKLLGMLDTYGIVGIEDARKRLTEALADTSGRSSFTLDGSGWGGVQLDIVDLT